jgi:hypothetical protein
VNKTLRNGLRVAAFASAGLLVAALGGLVWVKLAPRPVPPGQPPLVTLGPEALPAFRDAFNDCTSEVCVLALFSPT